LQKGTRGFTMPHWKVVKPGFKTISRRV